MKIKKNVLVPTVAFVATTLIPTSLQAAALVLSSGGDTFGNSSFTSPLTGSAPGWSASGSGQGVAATSGNTYSTEGKLLRGPGNSTSYTFAGDSLTINNGRFILKGASTGQVLTVNNLILSNAVLDQSVGANGNTSTIGGNILVSTASTMGANTGETMFVTSNISGSANLQFGGAANIGNLNGTTVLSGNNNAYSGNITVGTAGQTAILSATSDFALGTGNVSVISGTLSLGMGATNNYISDLATLSLAAGTTANLGFTGSDTVGSLVLGGAAQMPGMYNSSTPIVGSFFTGGGSIVVVPEPSSALLIGLGAIGFVTRRRR